VKTLRYLLAAIVALLFLLIVVLIGMAGDTLLSLWDRLQQAPWFVGALFSALLAGFAMASGYVIWKLLRPPTALRKQAEIVNEDSLMDRVNAAEASGLDIDQAQLELQELSRRRDSGTLYIALFGTISTGKSSLVQALLPGAEISIDVAGGSTSSVSRYVWMTPGGDQITLIDMPGLHDPKATLDRKLVDEASRAHMVIYLCDGDLARTQLDEIQSLAGLGKPIILALNKLDWFSKTERSSILERLRERTQDLGDIDVVAISTRTRASVHVRNADGTETAEMRDVKPDIASLARALLITIGTIPYPFGRRPG